MKILVEKRKDSEKEYDLTIESGHFKGTLEHVSRESIVGLGNSIERLLSDPIVTKLMWNPRAGRHERVEI